MKRRPLHALLLLVTVLCGQWLCIAHAVQHEAMEPASSCDYCVSGIGHAPPPDPGQALALPRAATLPPPAALVAAPSGDRCRLDRIRGPPLSSV